jgi:long-chain acyl-CoA synthetase
MRGITLDGDLEEAAARAPDRLALTTHDAKLTYGELVARGDQVARGLRALGVARGDRVALVLPNGWQAIVAIQGVLRARAALVPLNPTIKADRLAHILGHSGARVVVADRRSTQVVDAARALAPQIPEPVGLDEPLAGGSLLAMGEASDAVPARPIGSDLAALVYTSGSTGKPKGVTLSHANMAFTVGSIVEYLGVDDREVILSALSLAYGYGLYQALAAWRTGARLLLERGFTFPGRIVGLLEEERATMLPGVPTMFGVLTELKGLEERELPHLRALTNAGAALPEALATRLRRVFPRAGIFAMYGQTEAQRVCYLPPHEIERRPTSVGVAIPGTEVWVETDDGREAAPGEVGQLIVAGPHVMQGYWEDPASTARSLRQGRWPWERVLATGDLFRRDEDGYLYFVSRRDDIVKSRGEKVAPREVEEVLSHAGGVRDAVVLGVDDDRLGQALHAHVAPAAAIEFTEDGLKAFCAERMESFKVPHRVFAHEALPLNASGKIDRLALAELSRGHVAAGAPRPAAAPRT